MPNRPRTSAFQAITLDHGWIADAKASWGRLTRHQKHIAAMFAFGFTAKEIAKTLGVQPEVIYSTATLIKLKLNVSITHEIPIAVFAALGKLDPFTYEGEPVNVQDRKETSPQETTEGQAKAPGGNGASERPSD